MVVLEDRAGADPELSHVPVSLCPTATQQAGRGGMGRVLRARPGAVCVGGRGQRQAGGLGCVTRGAVSFLSSSRGRDGAQGRTHGTLKQKRSSCGCACRTGGGGGKERGETPTCLCQGEGPAPPTPSVSSRRRAARGPQLPGTSGQGSGLTLRPSVWQTERPLRARPWLLSAETLLRLSPSRAAPRGPRLISTAAADKQPHPRAAKTGPVRPGGGAGRRGPGPVPGPARAGEGCGGMAPSQAVTPSLRAS